MVEVVVADIVVAGGGTAGCVVAGRLSDAFPGLKIVIIENGPESKDDPVVQRPFPGIFQVWKAPESVKYYQALPNEHMLGQQSIVPTGNILGGGTCVNWLAYQNAAKSDFDDWNQPGWSFDELLPAIKKTTKFGATGDPSVHGLEGAMPVSFGGFKTRLGEHVNAAFAGSGVPYIEDMADFVHGHGYGQAAKWIGKDGTRSTAASCYVYNKTRPNLTILTRKTVIRVMVENGQAVGVEICDAPAQRGDVEMKNISEVKALRQLVVCAGALGTPPILERSGIGSKAILKKLGIDMKVDLPGVGKEYQDHQSVVQGYKVQDIDGLDGFARRDPEILQKAEEQWQKDGTGILATSVIDYMFKLRPTDDEVKDVGSELAGHWQHIGQAKSDKPLITGALGLMYLGDYSTIGPGYYLSICHWLNYPGSRGSLHIKDTNPHVAPAFDTGMLSHPADIIAHIWAYKTLRDIARRLPCYLGEEASKHPKYDIESSAVVKEIDNPQSINDKLAYTPEDEEAIHQWIRRSLKTTWHSMATCPMKARTENGVVDARLNVYGIKNLKLADLSICPKNVGCNTASVALIVGEKCAEFVREDLCA